MIINLKKFDTVYQNPVLYQINGENFKIAVNDFIGKKIKISYLHEINCVVCGRKTLKSFAQGYCYPCFISAPEASECVLNPEKCEAHVGISRDLKWSETYCLSEHVVYLAVSNHVKVGVTRAAQVPVRWIDQGASFAVKIAQTPNRYLAGCIEVDLKKNFSDKTNWQKMLKNEIDYSIDLLAEKEKAYNYADDLYKDYFTDDDTITEINYPVLKYPAKVKSIDLEKEGFIDDTLVGIKGQYLIFESERVINVRKYSGYKVDWQLL